MLKINRRSLFAASRNLIAAAVLGKSEPALADDLLDFSALKPVSPPQSAPDVGFLDADGNQIPLSHWRGQALVLNFWATWCPPCVAELPSLDRLAAQLAGRNITVLAVSEDLGAKAAGKVRDYYAQHQISHLPVLVDHYGRASDGFANQGVPTTLLLDRNLQLRARFEGGTDWTAPAALAAVGHLVEN